MVKGGRGGVGGRVWDVRGGLVIREAADLGFGSASGQGRFGDTARDALGWRSGQQEGQSSKRLRRRSGKYFGPAVGTVSRSIAWTPVGVNVESRLGK